MPITSTEEIHGALTAQVTLEATLSPAQGNPIVVTDVDGDLTVTGLVVTGSDGNLTILSGAVFSDSNGNITAYDEASNGNIDGALGDMQSIIGALAAGASLGGSLSSGGALNGELSLPGAYIPSNYGLITWNGSYLTVS